MTPPTDHNHNRVMIFDTTLRDGEQSPGLQHEPARKAATSPARWPSWASTSSRPVFRSLRRAISKRCSESRGNSSDRRSADWPAAPRRHRPRRGGAARRRQAAHSRLPRHQRHPSRVQAEDGQGTRSCVAPSKRESRAKELLRRRRVFARRRLAHRARLSRRSRRAGASRPARRQSTSPTPSAMPSRAVRRVLRVSAEKRPRHRWQPCSASIATTIWAWPSPTAWRRSKPARGRSSARSTASANGPATRRSKKSSWRCAPARDFFELRTQHQRAKAVSGQPAGFAASPA